MNRKGQIMSLDFVLAAALAILLLAMVLQASELSQYNLVQAQQTQDLYNIGNKASTLLSSDPSLNCWLVQNNNGTSNNLADDIIITSLPDCLTISLLDRSNGNPNGCAWGEQVKERRGLPVLKDELGIPQGYGCNLQVTGDFQTVLQGGQSNHMGIATDCTDTIPDNGNVFSTEKSIVVFAQSASPGGNQPGQGNNNDTKCSNPPTWFQRLSANVFKAQFLDCVNNPGSTTCPLYRSTATLKIWKVAQ